MGVGSFKDPDNAHGLAHYLEHMLFMGTAKYPDENDYSNVHFFLLSSLPKMQEVIMPTPASKKPTTCSKSLPLSFSKP